VNWNTQKKETRKNTEEYSLERRDIYTDDQKPTKFTAKIKTDLQDTVEERPQQTPVRTIEHTCDEMRWRRN
jgi:hypothetical protein